MNSFFWYISTPVTDSNVDDARFNGVLKSEYAMPAFRCCGTRVGFDMEWIDAELPQDFRCNPDFFYSGFADVSWETYEKYKAQLLCHPEISDIKGLVIERGKRFFPLKFSPPKVGSDLMTPSHSTLILTTRVLDVLLEFAPGEFSSRQVFPGYHLVMVKACGKLPVEQRFDSAAKCPKCGEPLSGRKKSRHILEEDMWPGTAMFRVGDTDHLFFTEGLKRALDRIRATNIHYEKVYVGQSYSSYYKSTGCPTW
jgi:hypothetical protein